MPRAWRFAATIVIAVAATHLLWRDPHAAAALAFRLIPVLVFVAAMSVVVNLAEEAGVFTALTQRVAGGRWKIWMVAMCLATVSTVFLSLDTTVLLVTPLVIALARRTGVNAVALSLGVIWVANLGSLLLPVSNLTNLLAVSGPVFDGQGDFVAHSWAPAVAALVVALVSAAFVLAHAPDDAVKIPSTDHSPRSPLLFPSLLVLAVLLPLLASPVPFWLSSCLAAAVLAFLTTRQLNHRSALSPGLIPWSSLTMITTLSTLAASVHAAGAADWVRGLFPHAANGSGGSASFAELLSLSAVGGVLSNIVNNIPAYLALEPAAITAGSLTALVIGVNVAPIVTPWASLATLLWADQLRRAGIVVPWRSFIMSGLIIAPVAVVTTVGVLSVLPWLE